MMISAPLAEKINEQVTHEFEASQAYLAMSCQFESMSLRQLAAFFRRQADEERGHALKFLDFLLEAGAPVALKAIAAPRDRYPTVLAAVEAAIEHEKRVTSQVHALAALADDNKDYGARTLLNWFAEEQIEEVSSMEQLADVCRMCGNNLLQFEAYMAHRVRSDG